jgi:hypothetical protein
MMNHLVHLAKIEESGEIGTICDFQMVTVHKIKWKNGHFVQLVQIEGNLLSDWYFKTTSPHLDEGTLAKAEGDPSLNRSLLESSIDLVKGQYPYLLILAGRSTGDFNFHYGHFWCDTLPWLLWISRNKLKFTVLMDDVYAWQHDIVYNLFKIKNINLKSLSRESGWINSSSSRYDYLTYKSPLKIATHEKNAGRRYIYNNYRIQRPYRLDKQETPNTVERILLIQRYKCQTERWINSEECMEYLQNEMQKYEVTRILPESMPPSALFDNFKEFDLIITAPGSAIYPFLLLTDIPILFVVPRMHYLSYFEDNFDDFTCVRPNIWLVRSEVTCVSSDNYFNSSYRCNRKRFASAVHRVLVYCRNYE